MISAEQALSSAGSPAKPNPLAQLDTWLRLIMPEESGSVFEIRALGCSVPSYKRLHNRGGYFDVSNIAKAVQAAKILTVDAAARAVYITLNPVNPSLLARRANRVDVLSREDAMTTDADILSRRWLLIDCDPVRASGVSSSTVEHDAAKLTATSIRDHLHASGWPSPLLCDSGNGWHLLYRIDLPADDAGLIQRCLHALAAQFSSPFVDIDKSVFNPSRICKLYGTYSRKGDHTEERPHRRSLIVEGPEPGFGIVPVDLLQTLAAKAPAKAKRERLTGKAGDNTIIGRARAYAQKADPSVSGQHGHDAAYWLACALRVGFLLSPEDSMTVFTEWNESCSPPWSERDLYRKIDEAEKSCDDEPGWLLKGLPSATRGGQPKPEFAAVEFEPFASAEIALIINQPARLPSSLDDLDELIDGASPAITQHRPQSSSIISQPSPAWQFSLIAKPLETDAIIVEDDPHQLAEVFLRQHVDDDGSYSLRYHKQNWHGFDGRRYVIISADNLQSIVNRCTKIEFNRLAAERLQRADPDKPPPTSKPVTTKVVSNVISAIKSLASLPDCIDSPCWLGGIHDGRDPRDFVAMANGIVDIRRAVAMIERDPEDYVSISSALAPHSRRWFSPTALPYPFGPDAECPRWVDFLNENLQGDERAIAMVQEWFGYCLTPDLSRQKFLMMEGEGQNGKSVICAVLRGTLGSENVSHVPLELFGERFALSQTIGKLANIASEVGELDRAAEGTLKAFVSGDRMTFDRKGISQIEAVPTARLVFATNTRPRFSDRSKGLWRRMLLLRLTYEVPLSRRVFGMDTVEFWNNEFPGVFNWALRGLAALRRQGEFSESEDSKLAMAEYQDETNPAKCFIKEQYVARDGGRVESSEMYQHYAAWCKATGHSAMNMVHFGREVSRTFKAVKKHRTTVNGLRANVYEGLAKLHITEGITELAGELSGQKVGINSGGFGEFIWQ